MATFVQLLLNFALVNYATGIPQISLEYNPYPLPSYNPNPGQNTAHTVPPGKPWPANPEDYNSFSQTTSPRPPAPSRPTVVNRFPETTTPKKEITRPNLDYGKPPISLEYNPFPLPSFHPNPGENTAHTVPPGKPWPANPEDYDSFSQTTSPRPPAPSRPTVVNRFPETTTPKKEITRPNLDYGKPPASLEYNPYPLPSYNPNPGENTALAIPPGKPWPANPEDYNSSTSTTNQNLNDEIQETPQQKPSSPPEVYLIYPEDLWFIYLSDRFREMISNSGIKPSFVLDYKPPFRPKPTEIHHGGPWPENPDDQPLIKDQEDQVQPLIVLDYKPNPPSYRPTPTEPPQVVPPGEPWPANPEDYTTFGQNNSTQNQNQNIENRFQEVAPFPDQVPPLIVLDYKPNRPFYRPSPTEIKQRVPPGEPWPANPEDYATFGQSNPSKPAQNQQNLENRFQETTSPPANQVQPLYVLDYKPNRPFYRPSPTEIQQVVPPGKPWPANPEDYVTFGQGNSPKPIQNQQQKQQDIENCLEAVVQPLIVLDYKPNRPFYRPSPTETQQVVPPGKPWPATPAQQTIENRFEEVTTPKEQSEPIETKPQLVLDYKPDRPSFLPNPLNVVGQVAPPVKPWSVTPTTTEEATTPKQENKPVETKPRPNPGGVAPPLENGGGQTVLEYYPVSSINQGSAVGQIVKPGKPWPANPEKSSPESVQNEETSSPNQAKSENSQSTTENNVELKLYTSKILNDVVSPTLVTSKNDSQSEKDRV